MVGLHVRVSGRRRQGPLMGPLMGGGCGPIFHVDFKKYGFILSVSLIFPMSHDEFMRSPCHMSLYLLSPYSCHKGLCQPVKFKKRGHVALLILGVYTHVCRSHLSTINHSHLDRGFGSRRRREVSPLTAPGDGRVGVGKGGPEEDRCREEGGEGTRWWEAVLDGRLSGGWSCPVLQAL